MFRIFYFCFRQGCEPSNEVSSVIVSILIVPYTNTQRQALAKLLLFNFLFRIESCAAGRYRNAPITATEAARAYADLVQRNWGESGCKVDLTILYIGTLHNPLTNLRQPNPFVVRLFS